MSVAWRIGWISYCLCSSEIRVFQPGFGSFLVIVVAVKVITTVWVVLNRVHGRCRVSFQVIWLLEALTFGCDLIICGGVNWCKTRCKVLWNRTKWGVVFGVEFYLGRIFGLISRWILIVYGWLVSSVFMTV